MGSGEGESTEPEGFKFVVMHARHRLRSCWSTSIGAHFNRRALHQLLADRTNMDAVATALETCFGLASIGTELVVVRGGRNLDQDSEESDEDCSPTSAELQQLELDKLHAIDALECSLLRILESPVAPLRTREHSRQSDLARAETRSTAHLKSLLRGMPLPESYCERIVEAGLAGEVAHALEEAIAARVVEQQVTSSASYGTASKPCLALELPNASSCAARSDASTAFPNLPLHQLPTLEHEADHPDIRRPPTPPDEALRRMMGGASTLATAHAAFEVSIAASSPPPPVHLTSPSDATEVAELRTRIRDGYVLTAREIEVLEIEAEEADAMEEELLDAQLVAMEAAEAAKEAELSQPADAFPAGTQPSTPAAILAATPSSVATGATERRARSSRKSEARAKKQRQEEEHALRLQRRPPWVDGATGLAYTPKWDPKSKGYSGLAGRRPLKEATPQHTPRSNGRSTCQGRYRQSEAPINRDVAVLNSILDAYASPKATMAGATTVSREVAVEKDATEEVRGRHAVTTAGMPVMIPLELQSAVPPQRVVDAGDDRDPGVCKYSCAP